MRLEDFKKSEAEKGSGKGSGSGSSPRSGKAPIDSPIPGSPSPQAPSAGGQSGNGGGTKNNFAGATFNIYGAGGRKEFVRELDQDLASLNRDGRRAS